MNDSTANNDKSVDLETEGQPSQSTTQSSDSPVDSVDSLRQNQGPTEHILRSFDLENKKPTMKTASPKTIAILSIVAIIAGVGTGYGGYKLQAKSGSLPGLSKTPSQQIAGDVINNGDVFGVEDKSTFKDSAEGYLEIGGLDGEGSHRLLRPGGESQTVYLTSSITDLDKFQGMEVKVAGETFKGQKAGWLMDVGRVEIINTDASAPEEE